MIRVVHGPVLTRTRDALVIDTGGAGGGIGFKVFVPEATAARHTEGAAVLLHTYLQVREDALTLYGFESDDELSIFELLLTVSGVGPRLALAILSTLSPDALRLALANTEPALLARTPGVGKRTAEKIVLELKDKVKAPATGLDALAQLTTIEDRLRLALSQFGGGAV
jgi:Holliday junction DNA helicase RuvA